MEPNFWKGDFGYNPDFRWDDLPTLVGRFVRVPYRHEGPFGLEIDGRDNPLLYHVMNILDRLQPTIDQFLNHHVTISFVVRGAYQGPVVIPIKIVSHHEIADLALQFSQEGHTSSSLDNWLRAECQLLAKTPDPTSAEMESIRSTIIPGPSGMG